LGHLHHRRRVGRDRLAERQRAVELVLHAGGALVELLQPRGHLDRGLNDAGGEGDREREQTHPLLKVPAVARSSRRIPITASAIAAARGAIRSAQDTALAAKSQYGSEIGSLQAGRTWMARKPIVVATPAKTAAAGAIGL